MGRKPRMATGMGGTEAPAGLHTPRNGGIGEMMDASTKTGAGKLCSYIEDYWHSRGLEAAKAYPSPVNVQGSTWAFYGVKCNVKLIQAGDGLWRAEV